MSRCRLVSFCLVFVSFFTLIGCADYEKNKVIEEHCGTCHSTERIYQKKRTKEEWRKLVHGMKMRGLKLTKEEEKKVFEELFQNYLKK
ncbi:hypothetical protein [Flexistipes sinusarabici]|uniref:hypothetical protein n=1 Tax=Flexistipes sinusarabici TaxID=2352 RepID=UPI0023528DC1|nr:hypothetical protein [Flexistipes sinusarabici]